MTTSDTEPSQEFTFGFLIFGIPSYWFPVIVWRGKCYALFLQRRWPPVRVQHFGLEMPLQEERS